MSFVKVSTTQFFEWADTKFGEGNWDKCLPSFGKEIIIRHKNLAGSPFELHLYTSLTDEAGETRDLGEDAIRVVLFDPKSCKPVMSTKKVLRVEGKTMLFDRVNDRVAEAAVAAQQQHICRKCGSHLVERTNRNTGEKFYGCSAYPDCPAVFNRQKYYPLRNFDSVIEADENDAQLMGHAPEVLVGAPTPEVKAQDYFELEEDLVSTDDYPHVRFPFPHFNRVQSTILKHRLWAADCNLVLGTTTSSGKTISAELFLGHTLAQGKKVLYVAPLKSLSQEKFDEWGKRYPDKTITILTGDYILTDKRAEELKQADILCLTSEMVDSRTRNYKSERSEWLFDVGLVITDESHILGMPDRGHAVEAGLVRFAKLVPQARILCLSATLPNVEEFRQWLSLLNGKPTKVINSDWRPTKLTWHYTPHITNAPYWTMQGSKMELAELAVTSKPDEKFLVFVHDKNTGRTLESRFNGMGVPTKFHNADLEMEDRLQIERSFEDRENGLRVLISTSTLAWGRNLPARNVVITGVHRGINDVEPLDIIQMGGRAGRYLIDTEGDVFLICDYPAKWSHLMVNQSPIRSTLLNRDVLGFHILAEIRNGEIWNKATLLSWFSRTLAFVQSGELGDELIAEVFDQLSKWGMVFVEENGVYKITRLGRVSASLYYMPKDVRHWASSFDLFNNNEVTDLWKSDLALAYALGTTPSIDLDYVPAAERDMVAQFTDAVDEIWPERVKPSVIAAKLYEWFSQQERSHYIRGFQSDNERLVQALTWIDGIKQWHQAQYWKALPLRLRYGVGAELVELCGLPGIGATRAKRLYVKGITGVDLFVHNPKTVEKLLGKATAAKAMAAAKAQLRQMQTGE